MSKKILICDDDQSTREGLKTILAEQYDLILCDSHVQCMECLTQDQNVGLVMLDIKMPEANGIETLKEIKEKHKSLPVALITGYSSTEIANEAAQSGADSYLTKPFKAEDILATVEKYLN
ncbi:hypothetical protein MNBD_UNCLBAC01-420 [hydrothermal vent metagenome]|uniref:Response regulatory domain-containing protein n=1 Tax=hydrothermal vent metagenome TaxID=652676 RepID=A0A3B1DMB1_9ZZZZ